MRERAHVAGALDVVLSAQRVHADAGAADIAGRHGEVRDRHHRGRALAVLGDAEAIIDRGIAAGGVQARRAADGLGRNAGQFCDRLRAVALLGDERRPILELVPVAALAHEGFVHQPLGDDDVRQRREYRDVGAGEQRQVIGGLDVRRAHEIDAARIDDDELRALAQPLLQPRGEDRMAVGRIGAEDDDHVAVLDRVEILRAGRCAEGGLEAVAGRRVADAGAGIDVVVAEAGAHQLLDQEGLLIGAARRGDAADRALAVFRLDALEFGGRVGDRLVPRHLAPRVADPGADHRLEDAVLVGRVAPGEAALDAGVTAVRLAVLVGHHAHDLVAAHLGLERAADTAIGAGRDDRMLGLADLDDRFLGQASRSDRPARRRRRTRIPNRRNDSSMPGDTTEPKPRPAMVSAKVPCTSSQARTQREQTMHFDGS